MFTSRRSSFTSGNSHPVPHRLAEDSEAFHGVPTGWHLKSIAVAWMRAILLGGGILALILGAVALNEQPVMAIPLFLGGVVGIGAMIGSCYLPYTGYASYEAACELADQISMTPEFRHKLEVAYGRLAGQQTDQFQFPQQQQLPQQTFDDPYRPQQRF